MDNNKTNTPITTADISDKDVRRLKAWARDHRGLAKAVCAAKVIAEMERERVNAYILPVFNGYTFTDEDGEKISNPEHLYNCEDDDLTAAYYAACDSAHRDNGFDGPEGHCPALIAESLLVDAESVLLVAVGEFSGFEGRRVFGLELRTKVLEWGLKVCLGNLK